MKAKTAKTQLLVWFVLILCALYLFRNGLVPAWRTMTTDFPNYYVSARVITAGQDPALLYDDVWFNQQIAAAGISQAGRFSTFPPATAFVLLPLSTLSPTWARRVWMVFNLGMLVLLVFCLARLTGGSMLHTALPVLLCASALVSNFRLGQMYLTITALSGLALLLAKTGRSGPAGLCLGACISVKYFPVIFLPIWWAQGRFRAILATIITCLLVSLTEIAVFGFSTWFKFVFHVFLPHLSGRIADQGSGYILAYQSFNSLYRNLFVANPLENPTPLLGHAGFYLPVLLLTFAVIAATAAWRWQQARQLGQAAFGYRVAILGFTAMVLLPISASYHLLLLIPSFVLLLDLLLKGRQHGSATLLLMGWLLLGFFPFWRLAALPGEGLMLFLHFHRLGLLLGLWLLAMICVPRVISGKEKL